METTTTQCVQNSTALCDVSTEINSVKTEINGMQAAFQIEIDATNSNIKVLKNESAVLKGIIHKHSTQLKSLNDKVAMLSAKSMENNITITGLGGEKKSKERENCKENVISFLKEKVEIDADESEIFVAHRIGQRDSKNSKPRMMLVRCKYQLKERIMKNAKNLKDKTNEQGDYYYINKQLPDQLAEQKREIRKQIKTQQEAQGLYAELFSFVCVF